MKKLVILLAWALGLLAHGADRPLPKASAPASVSGTGAASGIPSLSGTAAVSGTGNVTGAAGVRGGATVRKVVKLMPNRRVRPTPVTTGAEDVADPPLVLRWNNGESTAGKFVAGDREQLTWKTPLFEEPLVLRWDALDRITGAAGGRGKLDGEPFIFNLRDGSSIHGDLTGITADTVTLRSTRHGEVALKRSEVLNARRTKGENLVLAGPAGVAGWTARQPERNGFGVGMVAPGAESSTVATEPGGAMRILYWNRAAQLAAVLPEAWDAEFHLSSTERPDFALTFGSGKSDALRLETWGDEVVLASGSEMKRVCQVLPAEHRLALRICWDAKTRLARVYAPTGELLTEWHAPGNENEYEWGEISLLNRGNELTLEYLRVRKWDGGVPATADLTRPRLELDDGRVLTGEITPGAPGYVGLRADDGQPETSYSLSQVDAVIFSPDAPAAKKTEPARMSFRDGTYLTGTFNSIAGTKAAICTSFTAQPLAADLTGLAQLWIEGSTAEDVARQAPAEARDQITAGEAKLSGAMEATGDEQPRWRAVGGLNAVPPAQSAPYSITRAIEPEAEKPEQEEMLFYMRNGDVLPGRLRGMDEKAVEIDSSVVEMKKVPVENVAAVQLHPAGKLEIKGFQDAGWEQVSGTPDLVKKNGDEVTLQPGAALRHGCAMQARELHFTMKGSGFSVLRMRLFAGAGGQNKEEKLLLGEVGGRAYSGLETGDGQMADQTQTRLMKSGEMQVGLVMEENAVMLYVDGLPCQKIAVPLAAREGTGLVLEPGGMWGNNTTPVTLSHFSAVSRVGSIYLPGVATEVKAQALTVPRFRRDSPPRQALIATNGDVLRGELEGVTRTQLAFRTGLEELTVPRDRVSAVVWLKKPVEKGDLAAPSVSPEVAKAEAMLDRVLNVHVRFHQASVGVVISFLRSEVPGLTVEERTEGVPKQFAFNIGGMTLRDTLSALCEVAGLSYHVNEKGVVVIENRKDGPTGMVLKGYWLKPGPLTTGSDVKGALAASGVEFPAGTTAEWQKDAGELWVRNTPANQAKLREVLARDYDGDLGLPTHWIQMRSGARLGLAVEKFTREAIIGHQPQYGRCVIPMGEVCGIRSSPPAPDAAVREVQDWQLVYAPEPVLPTAGGDSSALLGKTAPPLKLPLLGAGEFNLEAEKGKVVVLDFWATWCGPCVRALPEVMEMVRSFPPEKVRLVGVNQGEEGADVTRFLQTRGWKLTVALDGAKQVGQRYGVEALPQTVIIGPDGKVAWVKVGYDPDAEAEEKKTIAGLLGGK